MSKRTNNVWVHRPRVISFKRNDKGLLVPANARAKRTIAPKRVVSDLELAQFAGYHNVKVYTKTGVLRALKV